MDRSQLEQLTLAKNANLDWNCMIDARYDFTQLREIRKGLLCGINVMKAITPDMKWYAIAQVVRKANKSYSNEML